MIQRAADMARRLPPLYREGELAAELLEQPALQIEIATQYALEVQRSHFFDDTLELQEAARLAAILGFQPEPWQTLPLFRAWVHAQRDAILGGGGVTLAAIEGFAKSYAAAYQDATSVRFGPAPARVIEEPPRRKHVRPLVEAGLTPLSRFSVHNRGLDETRVAFLLTGTAAGPEFCPLIVNITTGEALLWLGTLAPGQRLWLRAPADDRAEAQLEHQDATADLRFISGLVPGTAWNPPQVHTPPKSLRLVRGENQLWFLPVAHYEEFGLDRVLLALANLAMAQGRWDESSFDSALFFQDAAATLDATWIETEPASFEVHVPAHSVRKRALAAGTPEEHRETLGNAITQGVQRLKAAGVRSVVRLLAFSEMQGQSDAITGVLPLRLREAGASGGDRLPDAGGLFGVTGYGDSTYR
jgi:hypothetical protein